MAGAVQFTADPPALRYSNVVLRAALNNKSGLKFCSFNAISIFPKLDEIKFLLNGVNIDVVCVVESWLKTHISDSSLEIAGFNLFRNDRLFKRGGGVCAYVNSSIPAKEILKISKPNIEASLIELKVNEIRILLCIFYKPPKMGFLDDVEDILNNYSLCYNDIIICGDLNQDILSNSLQTRKFVTLLNSFSLAVKNTEPTYFCSTRASLLDLVITNTNKISFINQISIGCLNHDFLFFNYEIEHSYKPVEIIYRDLKGIDFAHLNTYCESLPWSSIYTIPDSSVQMDTLNSLIITVYDHCVPLRTITVKNQKPPWFDKEVEEAIALRNFAHHIWKRRRSDHYRAIFKNLRNKANSIAQKKKYEYMLKVLNPKMPTKRFWKNVNRLGINETNFKTSNNFTADDFSKQFSHSHSDTDPSRLYQFPNSEGEYNHDIGLFTFRNVDIMEVKKAIYDIKSNSMGLDGISMEFLKLLFPYIGKYILHIFNCILTSSNFPTCWKNAKILLIPKIDNPITTADFRPISILSALSKAFEKLVQKQISEFLVSESLLNKYQSAYRPYHGTNYAILNIIDDIRRKVDRNECTVLVLLDFSKAFDSVDQCLLIRKLKDNFKFSQSACRLVQSYLSNRYQQVFYNSTISESSMVTLGVPQGSILGPLFFSLYINDLPSVIKYCNFHLFADDVQIYLSSLPENLDVCISNINRDIQAIVEWSAVNNLALNASKTQSIVVYKKVINTSNIPTIQVQNRNIPYSDKIKNLGLLISKDLNWTDQINSIRTRVYFMLRRLWTLTKYASIDLKRKLFLSYIFPHFLYCDTTLFGMFEYNLQKIQLLFNAGIRYIYGLRKFDHISPWVNNVLGCNIQEYYYYRVCLLTFKLLKLQQPEYLYLKLQPLSSSRLNNLYIPRNKSHILNSSFFVRGISYWNSLPYFVKSSSSASAFKKNYFTFKKFSFV